MHAKLVHEGHDPQLEKAVEVVMEMLKENPPPTYARPLLELSPAPAARAVSRASMWRQRWTR